MAALSILVKRLQAQFLQMSGLLKPLPGSWRILMYHRITTPDEVPYPFEPGMYVTPTSFSMQLSYLAEHFEVLTVDVLASRVSLGKSFSKPAVAITFDDGLADNYRNAFPALTALNLPATVFLATSYIGTTRLFWSDALQSLCTSGKSLAPAQQILSTHELEATAALLNSIPTDARAQRELVSKVTRAVKSSPQEVRERVLLELAPLLAEQEAVVPRQFLAWEEAQEMGRGGITFGSHSHSHAPLPDLTEDAATSDIAESLRLIREHQLPESGVFCYPGGYFNERTQKLLTRFDFTASLLTNRSLEHATPPAFSRTGVHEDMSSTKAMFAKRIAR